MIIYFSGTGNSQYIAEAIADGLSDEVVSANPYIKHNKNAAFKSVKPWVFVFPIYVSAMAEIFYDFLKNSKFTGCKRAYFVATCAGDMGITPNQAKKLCAAKNLQFMGAKKIPMPQNYIALFTMNSQDEIKLKFDRAFESLDMICRAVKRGKKLDVSCKSMAMYAITMAVLKIYNGFFTRTKKFYSTEKCNGCGNCVRVCPLNNIHLEDGHPQWKKNCVHCMSCINCCPQTAIEYGEKTIAKPRYVCERYKK